MDNNLRFTYWNQGNTTPELWGHRACNLAYSANLIYQRSSLAGKALFGEESPQNGTPEAQQLISESSMSPIAYMLAGFAIENVLKGLIIQQINAEPSTIDGDVRLRKLTTTHDLTQLAKDAGIDPEDAVAELLSTLTEFLVWVGRYPRPRKLKDYMKEPDPLIGRKTRDPSTSDNQWLVFVRLFNELVPRILRPVKK